MFTVITGASVLALFLIVADLVSRLPRRQPIGPWPGEPPFKMPAGFLWGTATADHQIERAQADDWTAFELRARAEGRQTQLRLGIVEPGHIAGIKDVPLSWIEDKTNFDAHIDDDLARCQELGTNSFRFSISWARLFPRAGMVSADPDGLAFYDRVLDACEKNGQQPSVTLHHFALPQWLWERDGAGKSGYERADIVEHFRVFADICARRYGKRVQHWCTLNEPMVLTYFGYLEGVFPPNEKRGAPPNASPVAVQLLRMHAAAYHAIKAVRQSAQVGIAHHVRHFVPYRNRNLLDRLTAFLVDRAFTLDFMDAIVSGEFRPTMGGGSVRIPGLKGTMDYVGINFYGRFYVKALSPGKFEIVSHDEREPGEEESDVGWAIDETSFLPELERFDKRYHLPIYILENGIACDRTDDEQRQRFIVRHVRALVEAVGRGIDVRGFYYWSLIDNFEWAAGFEPAFGLYEVDYNTSARTPRDSVAVFQSITRTNGIDHEQWSKHGRKVHAHGEHHHAIDLTPL